MFVVLQSIALAAHLLAMNVAAAGPLVTPVLQWREAAAGDGFAGRVGRNLAGISLLCFLAGALLGLVNGWQMWAAGELRYFHAMERLPSKIFFGIWELVFYAVCMAVYCAWWRWAPPRRVAARLAHAAVGLAAATNLLWHFPPLMTVLAHLAVEAPTGSQIDAAGFRTLMFTPEIMSRWVHVWLASIATTGILVAWLSLRGLNVRRDEANASRLITFGGRVAFAATLLQLPAGVWLLMASPAGEQSRLMGGSLLPTALLAASVLLAVALLHQLASLALGDGEKGHVRLSVVLLVAIVVLMSFTLRLAREGGV